MSPPRQVKARADLIREGGATDGIHIIIDGWAGRYVTTWNGGRQLPALFVAGDVCNLDSLMFERLDYGVQIISDVTVSTLPREHAVGLARHHPGIARTFTRLAMLENVSLTRWALSLGRRSAKERLAHLLCELSVRMGGEQDGESCYGFPLTQEHIGDVLGLTPVHVNRTMGQLRDDGLARVKGRMMTLPDVARLRHIAGFDQGYLHLDTKA